MKYALIGCGRIAVNHLKAAINNELDIIALCDVDSSKIDLLLREFDCHEMNNISRYDDHKKMLMEHPEIELIAIATESGKHAGIAIDCIKAHRNILIEKPIAMSIADADEIIRQAELHDVKVSTCHQNRFNVAIQELRKAVENNRFGMISHAAIHVRWNRGSSYYEQAPWRGTWEQDGGTLMNQCIHGIDLLRWMMQSEPVEVFGVTRQRFHDYIEAEDIGVAVIKFEDGSIATIEGTSNVFPKNLEETLYIFGENGTAKIGGTSANNIDVWEFKETTEDDQEKLRIAEETSNVYGNGHTRLYADMISAISQNRQPYVDAIAGKNALEIVLAIYKSQKTGLPVKLPLSDFSSCEMKDVVLA